MNLRSQKGISMITLSVAIIVLVVITSMLVYNAKDGTHIKNLNNLYNDIETLNDKVSAYYLKYGDIPKIAKYTNMSFLNNAEANQINPNNGEDFFVIDLKTLEGVSLNYGKDYNQVSDNDTEVLALEDLYIINEQSHTIYYPKGIEVEGIKYYTSPDEWAQVQLVEVETTTLAVTDLVKGNTVYYKDANNNEIECTVLYDSENENYSTYGVQIIPRNPVMTKEIGNGTGSSKENDVAYFNIAKEAYNNVVNDLNTAAQDYVTANPSLAAVASGSRCVGNYNTDQTQLNSLGIATITDTTNGSNYWLASRATFRDSDGNSYTVSRANDSGGVAFVIVCREVYSGGRTSYNSNSLTFGIRPCITLKSNIEIVEINGKKYLGE